MPQEKPAVFLRWLIKADMPEIEALEDASSIPCWSNGDFLRCLRKRNRICLVAERGERILGCVIYEIRPREIRILKLTVHPAWRRHGIGSLFLAALVKKAAGKGLPYLTIAVRPEAWTVHRFLGRWDFEVAGQADGLWLFARSS